MTESIWDHLDAQFRSFPVMRGLPATREAIDEAMRRLGRPFPPDYRVFLERYGAGLVGSFPVFGLGPVEAMGEESVVDINERYQADKWPGIANLLIVSEDLGGNPIGADSVGRIWISDHGRLELLAENFEAFVRTHLDSSATRSSRLSDRSSWNVE